MNENNENNATENNDELDLSSLSALDFNPSWAADGAKKISVDRPAHNDRRGYDRRPPRRDFGGDDQRRAPRDRRGPRILRSDNSDTNTKAPSNENGRRDFPRSERRRDDRGGRFARGGTPEFRPPTRVAEVSIFPEDKPFTVLAKAIKSSARTYVLFEVANIILEKPERFVVVVSPLQKKDKNGNPVPGTESAEPFYISIPDGLPFLNETDALAHVFKTHLDKFFDIEEVETEAPKGNFTMIAKCGFTGEMLAPPNYHAYQQILRDHHNANFPKMPFEKFMSRIETVKDQEQIDAWIEKMKKTTHYVVKDRQEGEPEFLDNATAAKSFILSNRKDKAVKTAKQARFSGSLVEKMPMGPLKANIEHEISFQRKFPLNTANGFRGRLRHLGFSLYKKGPKGITLICGVKRKFRTQDSVFSDTIQRVFDFLEKNPGADIKKLPKLMLGIEEPTMSVKPAESAEQESSTATENSAEATNTATNSQEEPAKISADEEEKQVKELIGTVRWLVTEGYVSEMSDGKLYAHPVMTEAQAKAAANAEQPIERPEIPNVESTSDIGKVVPEAPKPLIKVIGKLAPTSDPTEDAGETTPDGEKQPEQ